MPSKATDKRTAAQAAWREMARGMRKFIAIQVERAVEDGAPRAASLAYIKEQIGLAIADAAGRLCTEGQPLVLKPAEWTPLSASLLPQNMGGERRDSNHGCPRLRSERARRLAGLPAPDDVEYRHVYRPLYLVFGTEANLRGWGGSGRLLSRVVLGLLES